MFLELRCVAAAKPARPAPMTMTPVLFCCGREVSGGGESREIREDALGGEMNLRRPRWREEW